MSNEKESFVSFVKQLQKEKTDDVIQIFDRKVCIDYRNRFIIFDCNYLPFGFMKSFYCVYGNDATFIANEYFKTLATLNHIGSGTNKLESQSIQPGQLENILMDLLNEKQYKFEIWAAKPNTSQWERVAKGSPGNVAGLDELFSCFSELDSLDSCTAAVRLGRDSNGNNV